jgi:hypothetical protein
MNCCDEIHWPTNAKEIMSMKPSANERDYFARQEAQRSRQVADERQAKLLEEERARDRSLHFMKCPKCGMGLVEVEYRGIAVDKCSACDGVWLDAGEFEAASNLEKGVLDKLFSAFRK